MRDKSLQVLEFSFHFRLWDLEKLLVRFETVIPRYCLLLKPKLLPATVPPMSWLMAKIDPILGTGQSNSHSLNHPIRQWEERLMTFNNKLHFLAV